ncbi:hypothetical protein H6CHR_01585 [Variovorax sp. PBL-H6]|nr:hypothetical protein H6CHR_01585 [Variovorax sp. PBL-H6]
MLPVNVVQRQFEAYNAHDLSAFLNGSMRQHPTVDLNP